MTEAKRQEFAIRFRTLLDAGTLPVFVGILLDTAADGAAALQRL